MRTRSGVSKIIWLAILALAAGLAACVILPSPAVGQPVAQSLTPTPTPTPILVRKVSWLNSVAARAPQGLQRTVTLPGGGGVGGDDCDRILLAPGAEAWFINTSAILLDAPHQTPYLFAMHCGANPDPNARFFLTDPSGNTWELPFTGDRTKVEYEFPPTSPEGTYSLLIYTSSNPFEAKIHVQRVYWPRLTLWDVLSPMPRTDFAPGQSMYVDYYGFEPGARLEVGFYRTAPGGMALTLVDLWQVAITQNGRFVETLPIPANAPAGEYALIVCDLSACTTHLDRMSSQLTTNVFWEEFTVTYPASVSSAAAGSGAPMWSMLSADAQALRMLFAGEPVRVLEGPVKQQNRLWYRVEHIASGLSGWVSGENLIVGGQ